MNEWEILKIGNISEINEKSLKILIIQNNQLTDNVIRLNENILRLKKNFREEINSIKETLIELNNNIEDLKIIIKKS